MTRAEEIEAALHAAFTPRELEVINESGHHAGHAGDDGSGESHFRVRIAAQDFAGTTRVARHRMVHRALGPELVAKIHALALDVSD
ncbi:BolA family protein [Maritimibacter dapengensis]|uniref:BolA family transcriptional regulator n=1 Tax=Maritimibacter dapengensis TaxID=2836868 RepID=A0ABS6T1G4_9RHOB|nr:BolA family protein [Maritimibacter dapengensis]MBV7379040.1 BolA family transcriptional regulator [Maritimibacter dapengensis]